MAIYEYTDEDGNEIDVMKVLTIIVPIMIEGAAGEEKYFLHHRQYQFEEIVGKDTYYDHCELGDTLVFRSHYKVVTATDTFYLPACFAVVEGVLRPRDRQDIEKWKLKIADQPRNSRKEFEKITGVDIDETLKEQHNGMAVYKEALRNRKKKTEIPYSYEQDPPESQTY